MIYDDPTATVTITKYEGVSSSGSYEWSSDEYVPNHFILEDGELKPMPIEE